MKRTTKPRPSISLWRMRQEKATPALLVRGPRARNDASAPARVAGRTVRFGPGLYQMPRDPGRAKFPTGRAQNGRESPQYSEQPGCKRAQDGANSRTIMSVWALIRRKKRP